MKRSVSSKTDTPDLIWSHFGRRYRVTVWPEVSFESETGGRWKAFVPDPSSDVFASASVLLTRHAWVAYLEFLPAAEREFVTRFTAGRLAALTVLARCPGLWSDLQATPALTPFVAAHVVLRGPSSPSWEEINVVHERGGVFGLLAWLGLPASKPTLAILSRIADPDLARRLFAPLRAALWEPTGLWSLLTRESLTERDLIKCSHSLAA